MGRDRFPGILKPSFGFPIFWNKWFRTIPATFGCNPEPGIEPQTRQQHARKRGLRSLINQADQLKKLVFSIAVSVFHNLRLFWSDVNWALDRVAEEDEEHAGIFRNLSQNLKVHRSLVHEREVDCSDNLM